MTTTAHRRAPRAPGPHRAAPAGERMLDPGVRAEVRAVVGQLVDPAAAQAREARRQLRCVLRLWLLAEEDRQIEWFASEELMSSEVAERVDALLGTDDRLVLDVAGKVLDGPSFPRDVRGEVSVTAPGLTLPEPCASRRRHHGRPGRGAP